MTKAKKTLFRFTADLPGIGRVLKGDPVTEKALKALKAAKLKPETWTHKV